MILRALLGLLLSPFVPRTFGSKLVERQQLVSADGAERLRLFFRTDGLIERLTATHYPATGLVDLGQMPPKSSGKPGRGGFDFHSLRWESRRGETWARTSVLTALRASASERRWVCDLHTFDPIAGTAVLRVGRMRPDEGPAPSWIQELNEHIRRRFPQAGRGSWCEYSWVLWNLRTGEPEKTLRVCKFLKEPLEGWPDQGR